MLHEENLVDVQPPKKEESVIFGWHMYKCSGEVYLELIRCEETPYKPECEAGLHIMQCCCTH